jgi:ketosteroid isomerase-like protein
MNLRSQTLLVSVAAVLCVTACARPADNGDARNQVQQVLDRYLRSVNTADVTMASTVWLQSPDIVVVTPLGRFEGWDSVQRDLYVNFLQKGFLERALTPSNVHIHVNGNSAWAVFDWSFASKLANGQPFTSKGRESHVYEKTDDGWRITHLHYSGLPAQSP